MHQEITLKLTNERAMIINVPPPWLRSYHYPTRVLCRVPNTLGKDPFALGKGFAECGTRQIRHGKKSDGETIFAECFFSGTLQSLCHEPEDTRQIFGPRTKKLAFKDSKKFYFFLVYFVSILHILY